MHKVYIDRSLKEKIPKTEFEEILSLSESIQKWIKGGNKKKIMQLDNSDILHRIHLKGKTRRMIFSYNEDVLKIYAVFTASEEKEKIRFYDNICKNEENYKDFIDITPKIKNELTQEIELLKEILKALETSALMGIPEKGKFNFDKLMTKIEKQKWIRKYSELKELYYKLRHDKNGELKLNVLLKRAKKREHEEKLIKNLLKIKTSAGLQKEVNARFENKPMIKASMQLRRIR